MSSTARQHLQKRRTHHSKASMLQHHSSSQLGDLKQQSEENLQLWMDKTLINNSVY